MVTPSSRLRHPDAYPLLMGTYWFWYPALMLFPIAMLMLGLSGYFYTARVESVNFLHSLQLLFAVVLLNALALRWLLVVHLRLAKEAALERHRAAREAAAAAADGESLGEAEDAPFHEPEVDLSALSDDTRGLIHVGLGMIAVAGLLLIWSNQLPAFRVLEDQVLWSTTMTVDGQEQQRPVTLMHLGLALLFAAATWVLLRRLPALLEILLLRRSAMSGADRYTVTTVTISALNRAINEAFADAGISIAFPQRDLHLDTTRPLQIELRGSAHTPEARGLEVDPNE